MSQVEVYSFENSDDEPDSSAYTTTDVDEAKAHAYRHGLKLIANIYEWSDSELVEDYTTRRITPQDTADIFLGSGALSWDWYENSTVEWYADPLSGQQQWRLRFTEMIDEPATAPGAQHILTHEDVMNAVHTINRAGLSDRVNHISDDCIRECENLLSDGWPDATDFDANSADEVIQYAAFGEIVYG